MNVSVNCGPSGVAEPKPPFMAPTRVSEALFHGPLLDKSLTPVQDDTHAKAT